MHRRRFASNEKRIEFQPRSRSPACVSLLPSSPEGSVALAATWNLTVFNTPAPQSTRAARLFVISPSPRCASAALCLDSLSPDLILAPSACLWFGTLWRRSKKKQSGSFQERQPRLTTSWLLGRVQRAIKFEVLSLCLKVIVVAMIAGCFLHFHVNVVRYALSMRI